MAWTIEIETPSGGGLSGNGRHSIFERIISLENLLSAWKEFRRGKRRKQDVADFEFSLGDGLLELHQDLREKNYRHGPYDSFYVRDPKLRHIHKASVRDRLLHQAVFRVLYPIFDRTFIYDSYSCRFGKGVHRGVRRLEEFSRRASKNYRRNAFALKCDVKKFFHTIDQDILLVLIQKKVTDRDALWLIEHIIRSFEVKPNKGLPLGNVTSQLFANIYLNELDRFVKHSFKEKYYLRYCDDFIILGENKDHLLGLIIPIHYFLTQRLALRLHPDKIMIRKLRRGIDFLGYVHLPYHTVLRTKTRRRMIRRASAVNLSSYLGLCKHANAFGLKQKMLSRIGGHRF